MSSDSGTWQPQTVPGKPGQLIARLAYDCVGVGGLEKRMLCCNGGDTGLNVTRHESVLTPNWSFIARKFGESQYEGKQMTGKEISTGAPSACGVHWSSIDWGAVESHVRRLQMRIAKAIREKKHNKAKALQWILTHSHYAKLLAVKRVTQNKGNKTPGVDNQRWTTEKQKMQAAKSLKKHGYQTMPLRRIYIPKKNGKLRPLGIPTMKCRAMQALYLLALEPIAETLADKNSYGFRPKRSTVDAIEQCHHVLCRKVSARWVLEGDIKGCFDNICHQWMLDNIPMDKAILRKWLKAGYMEDGKLFSTEAGTPQGGLCKALHKPPYAKKAIMQSNRRNSLIFNGSI